MLELNYKCRLVHTNLGGVMPYKCKCFESILAFHSAPSLLGIKCASLVSLCINELDIEENILRFNRKAAVKGLKIREMCHCKGRALILVYNEKLLEKQLLDKENGAALLNYGYSYKSSIDEKLSRLAARISSDDGFPHEVGIFLGYPLEDVNGFIENNGENFKLCGCWKVYGDEEKAKRTFENYNKCRKFLCNKLSQGSDIYEALKI